MAQPSAATLGLWGEALELAFAGLVEADFSAVAAKIMKIVFWFELSSLL
jgi:hypothetical protein